MIGTAPGSATPVRTVRNRGLVVALAAGSALLVLTAVASLAIGARPIPPAEVVAILTGATQAQMVIEHEGRMVDVPARVPVQGSGSPGAEVPGRLEVQQAHQVE